MHFPRGTKLARRALLSVAISISVDAWRLNAQAPTIGPKPDHGIPPLAVTTVSEGQEGTASFRRFFVSPSGERISPWHDLPLDTDDGKPFEKWMVVEIPRMTKAKFEINTKERLNPLAQDVKRGRLREYPGPIYWNYGFLPQTWEDPTVEHPLIHAYGDNDPLDVVEIGSRQHSQGGLARVRLLGALAMIDDGELDWKVIALDVADPLASEVRDLNDLEVLRPHVVSGIREWFRWYKSPDDQLNHFAFDGHSVSQQAALEVVKETHMAWKRLRSGKVREVDDLGLWSGADTVTA
mmetsp:Transcript_3024/g.8553  ORF Transcript_3024/g.8553 Transcript_3024/m.8553 type:complete len:294 (-) Transcript_3024:112-993(-)